MRGCPSGKVYYHTRAFALQMAEHHNQRQRHRQYVHLCPDCNGFHLTSIPPGDQMKIKNACIRPAAKHRRIQARSGDCYGNNP